jgi:hypothetical protein
MKGTGRTVLIILLLWLFLLAALFFRAFLLDNFVRPVALVFWMVWRILLSVNQEIYWGLLIAVALVYAFLRLVRKGLADTNSEISYGSYLTEAAIDFWRTFILITNNEQAHINFLKQNLVEMLVRMYTASQPETPYWQVYEGLQSRQIPLPEHIYSFLFPPNPMSHRSALEKFLYTLRRLPAQWARQRTGRAAAEYYQSLDEVLTFFESSLEINHDNQQFDPHIH